MFCRLEASSDSSVDDVVSLASTISVARRPASPRPAIPLGVSQLGPLPSVGPGQRLIQVPGFEPSTRLPRMFGMGAGSIRAQGLHGRPARSSGGRSAAYSGSSARPANIAGIRILPAGKGGQLSRPAPYGAQGLAGVTQSRGEAVWHSDATDGVAGFKLLVGDVPDSVSLDSAEILVQQAWGRQFNTRGYGHIFL